MEPDTLFDALGDGTRRRILELVRLGPISVGEIAHRFPVSQPAVSQHLKVLLEAGLVGVMKVGRRRIYSLRPEGFEPLRRYASVFWDGALGAFESSFNTDEE